MQRRALPVPPCGTSKRSWEGHWSSRSASCPLWTGWQNTVAARQTSLDECSWSPLPGSVCKFLTQILLSQGAFPGQEGKKESVTESEKQKESAWVYSGLSGSRRGVGLERALLKLSQCVLWFFPLTRGRCKLFISWVAETQTKICWAGIHIVCACFGERQEERGREPVFAYWRRSWAREKLHMGYSFSLEEYTGPWE